MIVFQSTKPDKETATGHVTRREELAGMIASLAHRVRFGRCEVLDFTISCDGDDTEWTLKIKGRNHES